MTRCSKLLCLLLLNSSLVGARQSTERAEDSLSRSQTIQSTVIGGYGNAYYRRDFDQGISTADLERVVLFVGHNFGTISFFSELEMEDAKVEGDGGGEIAFEQAYLRFNLDHGHSIVAGLFLPRIGILNENHLPIQFNGNERTQVETNIIPSTWRELGVGFYGSMESVPVNYSVGLVNGLNSGAFEHGSGIREGRFEGRLATANNLAVTGAVQMFIGGMRTQISGYYGGTVGLSPRQADSLQLISGMFGSPVGIGEADLVYDENKFSFRALGVIVTIPEASDINRAYANNTPSGEYGAYAEIGYDILSTISPGVSAQLVVFARIEVLDMNSTVPANGITDGTLKQRHIIVGINYLPVNDVVVKADVRFSHTGNRNPALILNPDPSAPPYQPNDSFLNLGIGFAF
ncbi:MAG TPA: hypothetical protein VMM57_03960 [Bacteroidota bacterium]|nr:hypothetical protein [Bacteroidota bacterium]